MKQRILDLAGSGPKGDGFGPVLLGVGILLAAGFFGYMLYDYVRMRKRARQMQGRIR